MPTLPVTEAKMLTNTEAVGTVTVDVSKIVKTLDSDQLFALYREVQDQLAGMRQYHAMTDEELALAKEGKIVLAVKMIRKRTNVGIAFAKHMADTVRDNAQRDKLQKGGSAGNPLPAE
jgi:hypothetical protein